MSANTILEEGTNVEQALGDKNWTAAMDSEYQADDRVGNSDDIGDLGEGWLSRNNNFTSHSLKHQVPNNSILTGLVYLPSYNLLYFYAFSAHSNWTTWAHSIFCLLEAHMR
jgi:hypothetical protein